MSVSACDWTILANGCDTIGIQPHNLPSTGQILFSFFCAVRTILLLQEYEYDQVHDFDIYYRANVFDTCKEMLGSIM